MVIAGQLALVVALGAAAATMVANWMVAHGRRPPRLLARAHLVTLAGVVAAFTIL